MSHPTTSVIGLGRLGRAVAERFAAAGVPLTVWNRTPSKAQAFEGRAALGLNAAAACAAGDLIVLALSTYGAGLEVLDAAATQTSLAGRTLLQLGSGTATDARTLQAWTAMHGMHYLDAALLTHAGALGEPDAIVLCAGDEDAWQLQRAILDLLGGINRYAGDDIGAAATLHCALLAYYYGAATAMLQGAALCDAERVPLAEYFYLVKAMAPRFTATADQARSMIPREQYAGSETGLSAHAAALRHVQRASHDIEVDTRLVDGLMQTMKKALTSGYGDDELAALFEMLRRA